MAKRSARSRRTNGFFRSQKLRRSKQINKARRRFLNAFERLEPKALLAVVAGEDFDGGATNLTAGFNPATDNQDIGPGDFFGVGSVNGWPQGAGVPFAIADDSVVGVSGSPFAADDEGIIGQNFDFDNDFFALSDSNSLGAGQTASWTFDVAGFENLTVDIDIASRIDGDAPYGAGAFLTFTAQLDAGPVQTLFDFNPTANGLAAGSFRAMDSGTNEDPQNLLVATGDATITKGFADGGSSTAAADLYLDKTVVADGSVDTFSTPIAGTGGSLTITLTVKLPNDGAIFDNIVINGDAVYDLQITEMWPGQVGTDVTDDWFEITNRGAAPWVSGTDPALLRR